MSNIFLTTQRTTNGVSIEWDVKGPLPDDIARQIPYAASLAMNRTAVESVAVVRAETPKHFKARGPQSAQFFNQSFSVTKFSRKTDLEIEFGLSRALMQGRGASLLDHEAGTDRTATGPNAFPFIPVKSSLRPTDESLLPRWAYPKALGLITSRYAANGNEIGKERTPGRRGSKRGLRAQENRKAFILRDKLTGDPVGIFRRIPFAGMRMTGTREGGKKLTLTQRRRRGTGQSTLELLFATPQVIQIRPKLGFHTIAYDAMVARIQENFEGMLTYATDPTRQASNASWLAVDAALVRQFTRGTR